MQGVDTFGWQRKRNAILRELTKTIPVVVQKSSDELHKKVNDNLLGNIYIPGKLPVRVITSTLRRSMKRKKISKYIVSLFSDENIASYNKYVHWGTRKLLPRRFLTDAVNERRTAIENRMRYNIIKAIRAVGQ